MIGALSNLVSLIHWIFECLLYAWHWEQNRGLMDQGCRASCRETQRNECCCKGLSPSCWVSEGLGAARVKGTLKAEDSESWTILCVSLSGSQSTKLFFPFSEQKPRKDGVWRGATWGSMGQDKGTCVNVSQRDRYNECPTETYFSLQIKFCLLVIHRSF